MENRVIYLTQDLPGVGGRIKAQPEDFIVEEIPLYDASGEGGHTYFAMRKRNLATMEAIRRIARTLHVSVQSMGYAGLKDAKAVTTQIVSVEGVSPERLLVLDVPDIEILWAKRHRHKLRIGHLGGNRFQIVIRDVQPDALKSAEQILDRLKTKGVPNRFGVQRFGIKGDSHQIGKALLQQDWRTALDCFLGCPGHPETERLRDARTAYENGDLQTAFQLFPAASHADERRVLKALMGAPTNLKHACLLIPKALRQLFLSAYQAHLFNRVLDARLPALGQLYAGDLAMKHTNGAVFIVKVPSVEQPRADAFEISPSGPLYGYKLLLPDGKAGTLERETLAAEGLDLQSFHVPSLIRLRGARRSLRLPITSPYVEAVEGGLQVSFTLPPGGYATVVLGELLKQDDCSPVE